MEQRSVWIAKFVQDVEMGAASDYFALSDTALVAQMLSELERLAPKAIGLGTTHCQ